MFKHKVILIGIFCAAWISVDANKITLRITPAEVLQFRKCSETCGKQHDVDPNELRKIIDATIDPKDKPHKKFMFCVFHCSGHVKDDGHFDIEGMKKMNPVNGTVEDIQRIAEDCSKVTKETIYDTMYHMDACFHKNFLPIIEKP